MNDTDTHLPFAPMRTATEIPESRRASRKLVIAFEPQQEIVVPVAQLYHPHIDPSVRPDARAPVEVRFAATAPTPHCHWGINE